MSDLNEQALALLQDLETRHQQVLDELEALNGRVESVLKDYARDEEAKLQASLGQNTESPTAGETAASPEVN